MHQQDNSGPRPGSLSPEPVRAYAAMNTVRALECLAFTALSAPELADCLGVSVRTARRLLQRLELEGFATQEPGHRRRYHATPRLAVLGRQMVDRTPMAYTAAPHVTRLAQDTSCVAHLWTPGYNNHVVCLLHADGRTGTPTVSVLCDLASASRSAAGTVLLPDRAQLRSSCYLHHTPEPTFAAAVLQRGHVIGALGVTGDTALDATTAVIAAATRLSQDLESQA